MMKLLVLCLVLSFALFAQSSSQCNDVGAVAALETETLAVATITAAEDEKQTCKECQPNIQKFAGKPICQITCRRVCDGESNRGIVDLSKFTTANSPLMTACSKKAPKGSKCLCYDLKQQLKQTNRQQARMLANEINKLCRCKNDSYDAEYLKKVIKVIIKGIFKAVGKVISHIASKLKPMSKASTTVEEALAEQAEAEALQLSLEIEDL